MPDFITLFCYEKFAYFVTIYGTFLLLFVFLYVSVLFMEASSADIFDRARNRVEKNIEYGPKYIPFKKIISKLKKTGSVTDTAKVLGLSNQAIYQRLEAKGLDHRDFTDYTDDKALSHEILQYQIVKGLDKGKIKKMNGGSSVLAICQLQDKIDKLRGESSEKGGLQVIINLANRSEAIDITPA